MCSVLENLDNCIISSFYKSDIDKNLFFEWTNYVKIKIDETMILLTNKLYTNKHRDYLLYLDVISALENIHKVFVVVSIDKANGNTLLFVKEFMLCYY